MLNEDACGYDISRRRVTAWIIDGASPLLPCSNEIVHEFSHRISNYIKASIEEDIPLSASISLVRERIIANETELTEKLRGLPKFAQPLAALSLVRSKFERNSTMVEYFVMGDCLAIIDGQVHLQRSKSENFLKFLTARSGDDAEMILRYKRARRRRQLRPDYCRWFNLSCDSTLRGLHGHTEISKGTDHSILLCSDGFYEPYTRQGIALGAVASLCAERDPEGMIDETFSKISNANALDDASAIFISNLW
ncbi:hypothetical protein NDN01_05015 [Sphingomonas sp. QA11]|uniref:hypothetical protein n=1 Tax=Sphingomonas sp. QA11 TaxID=2950605 RepID=UPI002349BF9C|nr:hypothetical protein [Sphingomonas sp. QA11]WCM28286.1 hypothetical protein NDN01_05015 [Sphingomonas sp. QA11]